MIIESFFSFLSSQATITALCKSIFPHTIPQNESLPAITYFVDEDLPEPILDGSSSLRVSRFNVDCWSHKYTEAHALADAVEAVLVGFTGVFGTDNAGHIRLERRFDLFETETKLYRVSMQFFIAYF